jgi:hypothetical protein
LKALPLVLRQKGLAEPLGAERYQVQFTADRQIYAQLQELRALMRHQVPDGDLGKILARAVAALLAQAREFLEFDHTEAWTWTRAHSIAGITLRCRAHNQQRARRDFGERHMARFRKQQHATGFESSSPGT